MVSGMKRNQAYHGRRPVSIPNPNGNPILTKS